MIGPDDDPADWIEIPDESFYTDGAEALYPVEELLPDAPVDELLDEVPSEEMVAVHRIEPLRALVRRGQRLLAKPHGCLSGPNGDPSPAELRAICAAIRASWSGLDLRRARCRQVEPVVVREVRVLEG